MADTVNIEGRGLQRDEQREFQRDEQRRKTVGKYAG